MTESHGERAGSEPRRIRAGDADRDRVVAALQAHREAGRLTAEEFEERMESALMARWLDELPGLLSDLPGPAPSGAPHADPRAQAGPPPAYGCHPYGPPGPFRFLMVLAPFLVLAALIGSVAAVAHGHFPFPLLWLGAAAFWFRPWWRWRRFAWPGYTRR